MKNHLRIACQRLSPLQSQTILHIAVSLMLMAVISAASHFTFEHGCREKTIVVLFAALPAIPMFAIILLLGRYLARERDEYIRMVAVKALLWGAAVIVTGDMVQSALVAFSPDFWSLDPGTLTIMNFDLFFTASAFSVAIQLRRNR
jgi:hypothetical protein